MVTVQKASKEDLDYIVRVHEQAFPDFFLTGLGSRFLHLYYESVLKSKDGILLISKMDDKCIGLCAGTVMSAGFNTRLIKAHLLRFGLEGIRILFTNPGSLIHLYKNMSKEDTNAGDDGNYAELLSIAVDPAVQHSGAGKSMIYELEMEVRQKGGTLLSLTTDYYDNNGAISFYKSLGFETWYDFITYPDRRMYRMRKAL